MWKNFAIANASKCAACERVLIVKKRGQEDQFVNWIVCMRCAVHTQKNWHARESASSDIEIECVNKNTKKSESRNEETKTTAQYVRAVQVRSMEINNYDYSIELFVGKELYFSGWMRFIRDYDIFDYTFSAKQI